MNTPPEKEKKPEFEIVEASLRDEFEIIGASLRESLSSIKNRFSEEFSAEQHREMTRGKVTANIVKLYCGSVLAIILAGLIACITAAANGDTQVLPVVLSAIGELAKHMSVLVLPIITLVLGFYFGSEKK